MQSKVTFYSKPVAPDWQPVPKTAVRTGWDAIQFSLCAERSHLSEPVHRFQLNRPTIAIYHMHFQTLSKSEKNKAPSLTVTEKSRFVTAIKLLWSLKVPVVKQVRYCGAKEQGVLHEESKVPEVWHEPFLLGVMSRLAEHVSWTLAVRRTILSNTRNRACFYFLVYLQLCKNHRRYEWNIIIE